MNDEKLRRIVLVFSLLSIYILVGFTLDKMSRMIWITFSWIPVVLLPVLLIDEVEYIEKQLKIRQDDD